VDLELQRVAYLQGALLQRALMHPEIAGLLLRVGDAELRAFAREHAGVADLATGLRVERGLVQHDAAGLTGLEAVDLLAVLDQRRDHAFRALGLVAQKLGRAEFLAERKPHAFGSGVARAGPGRARLLTLAVHRVGEGRDIDADAARLQRVLGEIEREAV